METTEQAELTKRVGIPDIPIEEKIEDEQGLQMWDYAKALSQFIERTETPMTIGLQGDWGSGKTSLMNLISRCLLEDKYPIIWINTWKYSQTEAGQALAIAVFLAIIHQLTKEYEQRTSKEKRREFMGGIAKALMNLGGKFSEAHLGVNIADALAKGKPDDLDEVFQRYEALEKLKGELSSLVISIVGSNKGHGDRVVLFVDDLDRVPPERAVEILEVLKIFLDINGLVFVLACDYEVILKGLRSKGELAGEEVSGRSFFDKIIQVPFQMPAPTKEKLGTYIRTLLQRVAFSELDKAEVEGLVYVLERTTGTNPRTIQRLINIVNLLLLVLDSEKNTWDDNVKNKQSIVFTLVGLQNAFPDVYTFFSRKNKDDFFEPITEDMVSDDPLLKRASEKKEFYLGRLTEVINKLKEFVAGDAELLIKFIRVSDIAAVEEVAPKEEKTGPTYYAKAYIEKQPVELKKIINSIIAGLPPDVTYHGSKNARDSITLRQKNDTGWEVYIRARPRKRKVDFIFDAKEDETITDQEQGGESTTYLQKFEELNCPNLRTNYKGNADWNKYLNGFLSADANNSQIEAARTAIHWFLVESYKLYHASIAVKDGQ